MKRFASILLLAAVALPLASPVDAARVRVVHRGARHRTVVVVRHGHPIRRTMHTVIIRRPAYVVRVAPARFLPLVVWAPVVIARPDHDRIAWQDAESIDKDDDWTEISLDADTRGEKLYLEVVDGRVQFDFAEVVFENGDCQVVDFSERTNGPGVYSLLDFKDGRKVDHVRLIARAKSETARVALLMRK